MVLEKYLTLPGGFELPIKLVTEVWNYNEEEICATESEFLDEQLKAFASGYLDTQMVAGKILSREETVVSENGVICLEGKYACHEMIGRVQEEEILKPDGKYD